MGQGLLIEGVTQDKNASECKESIETRIFLVEKSLDDLFMNPMIRMVNGP